MSICISSVTVLLKRLWLLSALGSFSVVLAAPPVPCEIKAQNSVRKITVFCQEGDGRFPIHPESGTFVESEHAYSLKFMGKVFNSVREFEVKDAGTQELILRLRVTAQNEVVVNGVAPDKLWYLQGIKKLAKLQIDTQGTLILSDKMEIANRFEAKANSLYALQPFRINNGTFSLTYEEGFFSNLNAPCHQSAGADHWSVLESVGTTNSPTKVRTALGNIPHEDISPVLADYVHAFRSVFRIRLERDQHYIALGSDEARLIFIKTLIQTIQDIQQKGDLGEALYHQYMSRVFSTAKKYRAKMGRNSFDKVYVTRANPEDHTSEVQQIIITEVKFAKGGQPTLGTRNVNNNNWRQMSLPYVKSVLSEMETKANVAPTAALILANLDKVQLQLVVFDPDTLKMTKYSVGDMTRSLLD